MRIEQRLVHGVAVFNPRERLADAFAHSICGLAGRGSERNLGGIDAEADHQAHDRDDDRSLSSTGTARHDRQPGSRRSGNNFALFVGQDDLLTLHDHGASNHIPKGAAEFLSIYLRLRCS